MAIVNIPNVSLGNQTAPYGGVIYGLNMNVNYSSEPSKVTIDIVNKDGVYATPKLNDQVQLRFGNFRFNGIIWSYNIKESAAERVLQITLVDNSIILDRFYVLLWKRGLLGQAGTRKTKQRTFDFSNESILVPVVNNKNTDFPFTFFKDTKLSKETVSSISYSLGATKIGNVILVGHEKFASSACDIPDTYYTFNDLKPMIPVEMSNPPNDNIWKSTHEGTLREVLSNWCSDLGLDFYWDFSLNTLNFYDVSIGVGRIPDISNSAVISKEKSVSMEGTFRQYGVGYTQMPKSAVKSLSLSRSNTILYSVNPYPISYFINKIGVPLSINDDKGRWGGNRSQSEFVHAGFLGFVSRSLRDLYSFQNRHWEALGYEVDSGVELDKLKTISLLKKTGFGDMISDLESIDAENLPNYFFNLINRDPTLADRWYELEQELLLLHGRYYKIPDSSGSFFYCNRNYTIEIEISVDPEGSNVEIASVEFSGKKILERSGSMSHDTTTALESLNYTQLGNEIQNCAPIHIDLKESGLLENFLNAGLLSSDNLRLNTLVIYPNSEKFVNQKLGFQSTLGRGLNPLEKNVIDIKNANIKNGRQSCKQFEENLAKNSCEGAEERARRQAISKISKVDDKKTEDDFVSGLITTSARFCNISLQKGSVKIFAPSDAAYQVVCRYNITVNKISTTGTEEFLWSAGSPGIADDVAEIRISSENVTDPEEDSYQSKRPGNLIKPADAVCSKPQEQIKYIFAGTPVGVELSPSKGLSNLDVSLSSEGFITTATFSTKPPKLAKANNTVRNVHSQFNRASFNAS